MSNNYSEYRTTIFPSRDERDVWVTRCLIAKSASPEWSHDIENFEVIGDRCLRVWHNGNVGTANSSKLLLINNQLTDRHPALPWLGSHHVEGNEYCFDMGINGKHVSFDSFPIMMSGEDEEYKIRCYKTWLENIRKVIASNTHVHVDDWSTKETALSNFLSIMNQFSTAQALVRYAKTDVQIESMYQILLQIMCEAIDTFKLYEASPTSMNIVDLERRDTSSDLMKTTLRNAWSKVNV